MGKVLAVISKRNIIVGLLTLVSGCGGNAMDMIGKSLTGDLKIGSSEQQLPSNLPNSSSEAVVVTPSNITVTFPWENIEYPLFETGRNRQAKTYMTPSGWSFTLKHGFLVATRSVGDDLMAAEIGNLERRFPAQEESVRVHDYLTGTDQIDRISFRCQLTKVGPENVEFAESSFETVRFDELCTNADIRFTNSYWIEQNSELRMSRQWVSQGSGYVDLRWY